MILSTLVTEALFSIDKIPHYVSEIKKDKSEEQKNQYAIRFLERVLQFENDLAGEADLLSALRDFILFVGASSVPSWLEMLVSKNAIEFGLYLENGKVMAKAELEFLNVQEIQFLHQVYGHGTPSVPRPQSYGDRFLYEVSGHKQYRSFEQKVAVHTALSMPAGYTLLISLPTGFGKSLVSQMLTAKGVGLTVIVVPTTALGYDQERAARLVLRLMNQRGQIVCYCGDISPDRAKQIVQDIKEQRTRLLITSPEALIRNKLLKDAIVNSAKTNYLQHLIVDEAHIVVDWGAKFRPEFQMLSILQRELRSLSNGKLKTILLSATMSDHATSVVKRLMSDENWIELRCDSLRLEPRYSVETFNRGEDLETRVIQLAKVLPKPLLIYELKPEATKEWVKILKKEGFKRLRSFSGKTSDRERKNIIQEWNAEKLDIIVGTSAFGMGIDKKNVRSVLHASLPENVSRFYQEVGRSGRDGFPSISVLCYNSKTFLSNQNYIVSSQVLTVDHLFDRWFSMRSDPNAEYEGNTILLDMNHCPSYFTTEKRNYRGRRNVEWNISMILFLARAGHLTLSEVFDAKDAGYFVRVSMQDIFLLSDRDKLTKELEKLRALEIETLTAGFDLMKAMAKNVEETCVATYFTEVFSRARPSCGGCLQHSEEHRQDGQFIFNHTIPLYAKNTRNDDDTGLVQYLVIREEMEPFSVTRAVELAVRWNERGFSVLVLPEITRLDSTQFSGLVLTVDEFKHLTKYHPSLLAGKGLICAFGENVNLNQVLYESLRKLDDLKVNVLYYCQENMFIKRFNRPIRHLVNAVTLTFGEAMEGNYV